MYYFCNVGYDDKNLSDESKKLYKKLYDEAEIVKKSIKVFKPILNEDEIKAHKKILQFKAKDIRGNEIDNSVFKDSKLTMINIWGTFCGPCIQEMPNLQQVYEDMKNKDVNIIGIITDTPDKDNEKTADKILNKKGVTFTNIIPDKNLKNNFLKTISGTPTTIFVDKNGNIVGEPIIGGRDKAEYEKAINDILNSLE